MTDADNKHSNRQLSYSEHETYGASADGNLNLKFFRKSVF